MRHAITVRLSAELSEWLADVSSRTGLPQGRIVRDHLEQARDTQPARPFMKLAGRVRGARTLSMRKGFSRS